MSLSLLFPPSLGPVAATARAELLAEWLSRRLVRPVAVEVALDYDDLEKRLVERSVDLAWAPPAVCARIVDVVPAVFTAVRAGSATFRAALIVRKGEVTDLHGLKDRRAAWVDPRSSGGYLLPMLHLRQQGHEPDALFRSQTFFGAYGEAIRAVVTRAADVAPVFVHGADPTQVETILSEIVGRRVAETLHPVAFTDSTPGDGLVVVRDLDEGGIDVAEIEALGDGTQSNMLLSIFEAERLQRASPSAYAAFRR